MEQAPRNIAKQTKQIRNGKPTLLSPMEKQNYIVCTYIFAGTPWKDTQRLVTVVAFREK